VIDLLDDLSAIKIQLAATYESYLLMVQNRLKSTAYARTRA